MAEQVREKKFCPVELVKAHLARIEQLNPKINAFVQIDSESALMQARNAEAAGMADEKLGPLHGVPISIKSSIDVSGMRWEAGRKPPERYFASIDAALVSRLPHAGSVILLRNKP